MVIKFYQVGPTDIFGDNSRFAGNSRTATRRLIPPGPPAGEPFESTVLDIFAGTMSAAIAAHCEGRKFVCVEQDPDYCNIGIARLKEAMKQGCLW